MESMRSARAWAGRAWAAAAGAALASSLGMVPAFAEEPRDWEIGMVPGATPVFDRIESFHNELLIIITVITVFVLGLIVYAMWRFNAKRHPVPSQATHNTLLEVVWTAVPILILVTIAIPSFKLLYYADRTEHADMTLKVSGHQWYWSYEYPDQGDFTFDSNMLPDDQAKAQHKLRLLSVDNPVVLPVGAVVRVLITGTDVIHSWYVPAAAVQEYAVVGRTNESWLQFEQEGTYYGQCNQICGVNHPFMPIEIHVVSKPDFDQWAAQAKQKFAAKDGEGASSVHLAAAAQ